MPKDSVDVLEEWLGEEIDSETPSVLARTPDDQLNDLWLRLADSYYGWDEAWLAESREGPALLYFGGREEAPCGSEGWINAIKSASLCFDGMIFRDPLAEHLFGVTEAGATLGEISKDAVMQPLTHGVKELVKIRPLVRTGAIRIAPRTFLGCLRDVQHLARAQLGGGTGHIEREDGVIDTAPAEFAVLSGLCTKFGFAPVAGTSDGYNLLSSGIKRFRKELQVDQLEFESVLNAHRIPNVDRLPLEDIMALRANSEAINTAREGLRKALSNSQERMDQLEGHANDASFQQAFDEELRQVEVRLSEELGKSNALKDLVVPLGASVGMGTFALWLGPSMASDPEGLRVALTTASAPGVAWIAHTLIRLAQARKHGKHHVFQLYGHLIG